MRHPLCYCDSLPNRALGPECDVCTGLAPAGDPQPGDHVRVNGGYGRPWLVEAVTAIGPLARADNPRGPRLLLSVRRPKGYRSHVAYWRDARPGNGQVPTVTLGPAFPGGIGAARYDAARKEG